MVTDDSSFSLVNHRRSCVVSCNSVRRSSTAGTVAALEPKGTDDSSCFCTSNNVPSEGMSAAATGSVGKPPGSTAAPATASRGDRHSADMGSVATYGSAYAPPNPMTNAVSPPAATSTFAPSRSVPESCVIVELPRPARIRPGTASIPGRSGREAAPTVSDACRMTAERAHKSNVQDGDTKKSRFPGSRNEAMHSLRELKKLHVLPTGQRAESRQVFEVLKLFMEDKKVLHACMAFRVPLKNSSTTVNRISGTSVNESQDAGGSADFQRKRMQDSSVSLCSSYRPRRAPFLCSPSSALPDSPDREVAFASSRPADVSSSLSVPASSSVTDLSPAFCSHRPSLSTSASFSSSLSHSPLCWSPSPFHPPGCSRWPPSHSDSSCSSCSSSASPLPGSSAYSGTPPRSTMYVVVDCSPASGLLTADTLVYLSGASLQRLRRVQLMALVHPNSAYGRRAGICSYQQVFDRRPDFPCLEQDDQLLLREAPAHVRDFDRASEISDGYALGAAGIENNIKAGVAVSTTPGCDKEEEGEREEEAEGNAFGAGMRDTPAAPADVQCARAVENLTDTWDTAAMSADQAEGESLTKSYGVKTGCRAPAFEVSGNREVSILPHLGVTEEDEHGRKWQQQLQAFSPETCGASKAPLRGRTHEPPPRYSVDEEHKAEVDALAPGIQETLNQPDKGDSGGQAKCISPFAEASPPISTEAGVLNLSPAARDLEELVHSRNLDVAAASGAAHTTANVAVACSVRPSNTTTVQAKTQLQSCCMKWCQTQDGMRHVHLRGCASAGGSHGGNVASASKDIRILHSSSGSAQKRWTNRSRRSSAHDSGMNSARHRGKSWNEDSSGGGTHRSKRNMDSSSVSRSSSSSSRERETRNKAASGNLEHVPADVRRKHTLGRSLMAVSPGSVSAHCSSRSSSVETLSAQPNHGACTGGFPAVRWEEAEEVLEGVAERHAAGKFFPLISGHSLGDDGLSIKKEGDKLQQRLSMPCAGRGHSHTTIQGAPCFFQNQQQEGTRVQQRRRTLCVDRRGIAHEEVEAPTRFDQPGERAAALREDEVSAKAATGGKATAEDIDSRSDEARGFLAEEESGFSGCAPTARRATDKDAGFLWCEAEGLQMTAGNGAISRRDSAQGNGTIVGCNIAAPRRSVTEGEGILRRATTAGGGAPTSRRTAAGDATTTGPGRVTPVAAERDWRMRRAFESEQVRLQRLDAETLFREFVGPYLQRKLGKRYIRSEKEEGLEKRGEKEECPSERRGNGDGDYQYECLRRTSRESRESDEKKQLRTTLVLFPGKELVIKDVTFVVWASDPAGVPGLLDEDTVIYICLDPYGEYRKVHFVAFSDTLPTTYEFDFYEDYLKPFLLENKWRNFRRGDVCSYRGVEFKLIATEPSASAGARVGPATVVYHEGTMQPTVMDVLPADVLYHIRRLPARMQPTAIIFAAQRLDPEVLTRVVPSSNVMRSRRGLNEQTTERLREKLVTPFSFAAYLEKYPDLCCRVVRLSVEQSSGENSSCPFTGLATRTDARQTTFLTGNCVCNSSTTDGVGRNNITKEYSPRKTTHKVPGSQETENTTEQTVLSASAYAASTELMGDVEHFEKREAMCVVRDDPSDTAHVDTCANPVVEIHREDLLGNVQKTALDFEKREGHCSTENAENNEEQLRRFERPSCTVCTLPMEERDASIILFCGHVFHWQCIHLWLRYNSTCPNCRAEITELFRQHEDCLRRQRASTLEEDSGQHRGGEITPEDGTFGLVSTIRRWISTTMFGTIEL